MSPGIQITSVWTLPSYFSFTQCPFFYRPLGWLLPLRTTRLRSSWFGIYATPVLQKEL